ncbi:Transcriptional regulator, contains XRE-family HTH domain [Paenibacillus algorifonticola]|uniref:Transcriptional regulator, contains XRE-family HTH domain n=1 Tax=Paenibacillus algorifonticola TaxID=684063 RepID=A0A1I2GPR1_9BACL|nr:helix-turn-helix transcriptional regulator [Paenibacillus algorifonticola]SFF19452.1 Transcriptional regulator, contains XRE-family HTH domain [Paenibacillus algorifonticola]
MFAKRLKQLRKKRKYSMQQLADTVGVAKSTYAGYESGYRQPTLETIQSIAKKLSTTSDYLLGLTDYPDQQEPSNNAKEFFNHEQLHWDGVPLEQEDLELVRMLLERVVRDRTSSGDPSQNPS